MSKQPETDDRDAAALLSPLAGDPVGPARIDVARAMSEGRRRRRTRWWASGTAIVAITATTAAGGTLAFSALGRPAPTPPRPVASPLPSITAAAPAEPKNCTVTRLPTDGVDKALVTGGDPSGRWHVGRLYPPGKKGSRPLVVWRDGKIADQVVVGGDDDSFNDINSRGEAVGAGFNPEIQPYAYRDGKVIPLPGGEGAATAINDAGVVVGSLGPPYEGYPVRWPSATAKPRPLPLPAGVRFGTAIDIDEAGNVLGTVTAKVEETGYLWLADGTTRRMTLPEVDGRKADMFWPAAIRNGWVVGRAVLDAQDSRSFEYFRYRIATGRYEQLPAGSGMPARVAANGWVLGEAQTPMVITDSGEQTLLPKYPGLKGVQDYIVGSFSDDGLVAAGYSVGDQVDNHPLVWRCR